MVKGADKKGKKAAKKKNSTGNKEKIDQEKAAKIKAIEEERLRKWEEDWDKKLKAEEALEDKTCCMSKGLCLRPKTQSNIWINITEGKTLQDIQLYFKHVPVPKPKPPPLPKLKRQEEPKEAAPAKEKKLKKGGKKSAKKK
ncbi:uncharacterized protein LOC107263391 [Cephus cinctus]|uniref:Uncharacterized protein LOC107263391 n=1 Tax=Cephus cinctus TaxID=211228 RepID=A0AAJ7BH87_CEPCN|nr:uncharacterized protein LOC107263391 [Cephus cinctus]